MKKSEKVFNIEGPSQLEKEYSLYKLIERFQSKDILDQENLWYCWNCQGHVRAEKTIQIQKCPNILIVQLNKLKFSNQEIPKITFPVWGLDLSRFSISQTSVQDYNVRAEELFEDMSVLNSQAFNEDIFQKDWNDGTIYDLQAVVNHYGNQYFGHYTAFAQRDNQWFEFDDERVRRINPVDVVSDEAYLLFYQKRAQ